MGFILTSSAHPNPERFRGEVLSVMKDWAAEFTVEHTQQNLSGRHGDMGLNRRTGNLAQGWNSAADHGSGGMWVKAWIVGPAGEAKDGAQHGYAWANEYGATIRPIKSKWLWIPTKDNQTPSGQARISPTEAIERGGFISWKRGPMFFAKPMVKTNKGDTTHGLVPLFVLKKEVTIKPRMGANSMWQRLSDRLGRAIAFLAGGAFNG